MKMMIWHPMAGRTTSLGYGFAAKHHGKMATVILRATEHVVVRVSGVVIALDRKFLKTPPVTMAKTEARAINKDAA
jgi:hypothetical protein